MSALSCFRLHRRLACAAAMEGILTEDEHEKMVLSHEPVPGYRVAFYVVLLVASAYLMVAFLL